MATTDRGLQAVPRGLDRNLTTYLQALRTEILRLSGMVRGSESSRAVRASETVPFQVGTGNTSSSTVDVGAIASQILRDGMVSERKLADRAVSNRKLTDNAVDSRVLAPGGVGNTALAGGAVTADKIAFGVIPVLPKPSAPLLWVSGTAKDGETVTIPRCWDAQPQVFLAAFSCVLPKTEVPEPQRLVIGSEQFTEVLDKDGVATGIWTFVAQGDFSWIAVGQEKVVS